MDNYAEPPSAGSMQTLQLAQIRVPLEDAGSAFETPDASGRTPIVVLPRRNLRIRMDALALAALCALAGVVTFLLDWGAWTGATAFFVALVLAVLAVLSAFFVRVPEGTTALLVRGGRHMGVLGSGTHVLLPWIAVSHVVTRRHIPFDLPRIEASTRDNVSAHVAALLTFTIADPVLFVYTIAAPDFDLMLQAASRDGIRLLLRQLMWSEVLDIGPTQAELLRVEIQHHVQPYGITIGQLAVTQASPQIDFLRSQEARQLATVRGAEQSEAHALAEHRLRDEHDLERMRVVAAIEREHQRIEAQANRLARLEELLQRYPRAAEWEWQTEQLEVARALAGNSRSIVHVGRAAEIVNTLWPNEMPGPAPDGPSSDESGAPPATPGARNGEANATDTEWTSATDVSSV
jgi:regulator of protease activity HflC (stomatin/prohibitin superfamily)